MTTLLVDNCVVYDPQAIDGLDEDGRVLVVIRSHASQANDQPGPHIECPDGGTRTIRVEVSCHVTHMDESCHTHG